MKKIFLSLFLGLFLGLFLFSGINNTEARSYRTKSTDVYVKGYTTKNGTYVQPHYRTPPNSTKLDNYSCIDNGVCGTTNYTSTTQNTYEGIIPKNATLNSYGDGWYCNKGYKKNSSTNSCDKIY